MSPWLALAPVFALCVIGSALCYTDTLRRSAWYIPAMAFLGAACAMLFAWATKTLDTKERAYVFSLWYDTLMMLAYYLLPLVIFGAKVSPGVMAGAAFVAFGLLIVKVYG
jgi:ABC-type multidrug transport system permease subunit